VTQPAALPPLDSASARVDELAGAVREGRPLPPPSAGVIEGFSAIADAACTNPDGWADVAEIVVAAEMVDRGFRFHHLDATGVCRRDELLLGDYCLVCAAELATRLGRSDVDIEFARAAMAAAVGGDFQARLHAAVETAVRPVASAPPRAADAAEAADPGASLEMIDATLHHLVEEDPDPVREPMAAMLEAGGKRLRPQLVYLGSTLGPAHEPARAATLSAVVEFIHNATLVHDDLVDESPLRRGRPSVHVAYGAGIAARVGDYYFGRAAELLAGLNSTRATRLIVEAVARVCEAQIEEFRTRGMDQLDEAAYLAIVEGKTAALFSGACAAGAALGAAPPATVDAMVAYGRNLGVAFQMVDDVLDFSPNSGKALALDLAHSVGLPLVYAAENPAVREQLTSLLSDDAFDATAAIAIVQACGALDRAMERARGFRDQALEALAGLPAGPPRERLREIADFAVERAL